jgi:hypothetical protein
MNHNFSTATLSETSFTQTETKVKSIPTYIYASVFASLCIAVGLLWDISWHMSVGRDGLFSPPHIAIYLGAVIAGVFSGVKVLKTSFWGSKEEKAQNIKFWGIFHGSLGAMFCVWGAFAMLTSAPFDDWWHSTYGLDVKILSPPHALLGLGMIMIQFGAMISVISVQNKLEGKADPRTKKHLEWMYALSSGFLLAMVYVLVSEYFFVNRLHSALAYQVAALIFPIFMVSVAYAAPYKWAATKMALAYTFIMVVMVWILPLFPAEPRLSPVYNYITRFQPYHFPMLLIVPAIALDVLMGRYRNINKWLFAALISIAFVATFVPAQWYFAEFLNTEAARGWFFGRFSWPYSAPPEFQYRFAFHPRFIDTGWALISGLLIAAGIGILTSRLGLSWGNWMKQVKR